MNAKVEAQGFRLDGLKWLVVLVLVTAGVVGNAYFSEWSLLYRVLGLVGVAIACVAVAANTARGSAFWVLLREAQVEIRKVVWPTRQETTQTTLIVVAVVLLMALLLWLLDFLIGFAASKIIG